MSQDDYDEDDQYGYDQDDYDAHDYEDKDDIEFVPEVAARERVGGGGLKFIDIEIDIEKGRKGRLSLKAELSPDQLFLFDLQKSYNKYKDDISIGQGDIEIIRNIVPKINYIGCKNPYAFLLGYYILSTKKGEDMINVGKFNQIKSLLKNVEEIKIEDIIRYSRLIKNHM
jgi:hypothetical protein